jgi:uncharacterized protein (TIGR03437 family)
VAAFLLLAALLLGSDQAGTSTTPAPVYSAASIVNSAAGVTSFYAPNSFISIYGQNLAYTTAQITAADIIGNMLPWALPGTGVVVLINSVPADIWYVSPTLINVLVPAELVAGPATIQMEVDGLAGPAVQIMLGASAPALFQIDAQTILATHLDQTVVTASSPAHAGEIIVLWASGLGPTVPSAIPNQLPPTPAVLADSADFQILLNGTAVDSGQILYVGAPEGYAGLFQVNFLLPANAPQNPEIRVGTSGPDGLMSPAQRFLPLQ